MLLFPVNRRQFVSQLDLYKDRHKTNFHRSKLVGLVCLERLTKLMDAKLSTFPSFRAQLWEAVAQIYPRQIIKLKSMNGVCLSIIYLQCVAGIYGFNQVKIKFLASFSSWYISKLFSHNFRENIWDSFLVNQSLQIYVKYFRILNSIVFN